MGPDLLVEHDSNDWMRSKINCIVGPKEPSLATAKRRKITRFGHVTRLDNLSKTILQGAVKGARFRGLQSKCWIDNIKEGTSLPMPE